MNLIPYSVYKQLGLGELKPTNITLSLADRSVKIPKGIVEDVLVKIDKFYYPVDFVVLDTEPIASEPNHVPMILGRPFLATANAIINFRNGVMQLTFGNMTLELNIFHLNNKHELLENQNHITDEVVSIGLCHAPDPGPTRLANPNRFRGAKPYTGTPIFFIFFIFF